jgi:His-Xaa-Ser system protein HxsD
MTSSGNAHTATVIFDTRIFSVETVKKAAYKYLDRITVDFHIDGSILTCLLSFRAGLSETERDLAIRDLKNEVLDQDLRERIKAETAAVRNLILAHAFSKTGLIVDEQVSRD